MESDDSDSQLNTDIGQYDPGSDLVILDQDQGFYEDESDNEADNLFKDHPILASPSLGHMDIPHTAHDFLPEEEIDHDKDDTSIVDDGMPEVVKKLKIQLLSGYHCPNHPSLTCDYQPRSLNSVEMVSLKHYIAWVDSHGTVKAYKLHAQILTEATKIEVLSLYMV